MYALPPDLDSAGEHVTGLACPDCPGVLRVRAEGAGHLISFVCRIGHVFSRDELLATKERNIEDRLWAAAVGLEELVALLEDLIRDDSRHHRAPQATYATRIRLAREQAHRVREFIEADAPVTLDRRENRGGP